MTFRLVFNYKVFSLSARELGSAGLLGVKVVESRLAGNNFPPFSNF